MRLIPLSAWRREALRTNLWLVPTVEVAAAVVLFAATYALDRAAYNGTVHLPPFVIQGTADASRQTLTTIAAALITVVGVVFSITIVTLTLASTQFGPRMLRNFIRDRVTQVTLGTFVATFVYAIAGLVSIAPSRHGDFVPHLSITLSLALTVLDLAVLIVFIDHIGRSIQLPQVISDIARDLSQAIDAEIPHAQRPGMAKAGPSLTELTTRMDESGGIVSATESGYLQFVHIDTLLSISSRTHAVIRLVNRPGHFVVAGHPLAVVWPPEAAPPVARNLGRAHATGPHRTLTQDLSFALDQLVEIALRALSPAVNDTFTAIACIDWLGDSLCKISDRTEPISVHRDESGNIRVITVSASYARLVERSFDKIRQASRAMPAVMIRQLDALGRVMTHTRTAEQREVLGQQAEMIMRACLESVPERYDREDVQRRYDGFLGFAARARSGDAPKHARVDGAAPDASSAPVPRSS